MTVKVLQPKSEYVFDYPVAAEFANTQMSIFWTPDEINVESDVQDLRVNMTEAERHGVITVLKLFTLYELLVGNEYWGGRVKDTFKRPEFELMASTFSFIELGVHAQFYNKLNEAMMLNTEEFYNSYVEDETLKSRIDFVNAAADDDDLLYSLAVFSMLEGAVLYSSFAFLKSFQSQGKNKLNNVCAGINFSVRDENLHSEAGAWLFNTLLHEMTEEGDVMMEDMIDLDNRIYEAARHILEHETRIIEMIFEKGDVPGLDKEDMISFVKSRINMCLDNIGLEQIFEVTSNPVADWFYKGINATQFHDFFNRTGNEYNRVWDEGGFTF